jgi:hypothetical protein
MQPSIHPAGNLRRQDFVPEFNSEHEVTAGVHYLRAFDLGRFPLQFDWAENR